jgi:hypothetical protein
MLASVVDVQPRRMTEREKRLLQIIGEDVMGEIKRRDRVAPPSGPGSLSGDHGRALRLCESLYWAI